MSSKKELEDGAKCTEMDCGECLLYMENSCCSECVELISKDALQLLERVETAETILRDILLSGNVKSCEREIRKFLGDTK